MVDMKEAERVPNYVDIFLNSYTRGKSLRMLKGVKNKGALPATYMAQRLIVFYSNICFVIIPSRCVYTNGPLFLKCALRFFFWMRVLRPYFGYSG